MATSGDDGIKNKFFGDLKHLFPQNSESVDDDHLVREFENVGLESNDNATIFDDFGDSHSSGYRNGSGSCNSYMQHPIRPDARDCPFFIRYGTCKFGPTCKFNHPIFRRIFVDQGRIYVNSSESLSENSSQIPCKFNITGVCKFGESCKFNHSNSEAEVSPLQLNVLGLPIRLGELECSFYLRTGICGYGAVCMFHHPDPVFIEEYEVYNSMVTGESMEYCDEASKFTNTGYVMHFSESTQTYFSLPQSPMIDDSFLYLNQNCLWNGYQVPNCNQEMRHSFVPPTENVKMVDGHPGSLKRELCVLNDVGLPLRPGEKTCWHYENLGLCKFGRACPNDHPKQQSKTGPDGSTSESSSGQQTQEE